MRPKSIATVVVVLPAPRQVVDADARRRSSSPRCAAARSRRSSRPGGLADAEPAGDDDLHRDLASGTEAVESEVADPVEDPVQATAEVFARCGGGMATAPRPPDRSTSTDDADRELEGRRPRSAPSALARARDAVSTSHRWTARDLATEAGLDIRSRLISAAPPAPGPHVMAYERIRPPRRTLVTSTSTATARTRVGGHGHPASAVAIMCPLQLFADFRCEDVAGALGEDGIS